MKKIQQLEKLQNCKMNLKVKKLDFAGIIGWFPGIFDRGHALFVCY